MIALRRILCPTDFSRFSDGALRYARALARWYGGTVVALHVHPAREAIEPGASDALSPEGRERLRARLREFAQTPESSEVDVQVKLAEGNVLARILDAAAAPRADLIVMGTHGLSGIDRLLLGSMTEKVLRKAACPVLTVPAALEHGSPGDVLFGTVLCPVDLSPASRGALLHASSLARESRSELVVLHVLEAFPEGEEPSMLRHFSVPEARRAIEQRAREELRAFVSDSGIQEMPETIVAGGKAYRAILTTAREHDCGLIVMGVQGRGAIDLAFFGSTTNHVVREASCPVLTIRLAPET